MPETRMWQLVACEKQILSYIPFVSDTSQKKVKAKKRVNVRRPDIMEKVNQEVQSHYSSSIVEKIRNHKNEVTLGNTTIRLARQFGFCYGVERAIDLAYAARRVFPDERMFLIGEIIHNPVVNQQLTDMGIKRLPWKEITADYDMLTEDDVVLVPAFGAPTHFMDKLKELGVSVVDTTCGDVMKVWRRVRNYAKEGKTSIIHGKAGHEETRATASRALGDEGNGHYVVILTMDDCDFLCRYIREGGDRDEFYRRFEGALSPGFDLDKHLVHVGVANQTTMLKRETEEIQRRVRQAVIDRDSTEENFSVFDTICGATQERQDALYEMLKKEMDLLLIVGGYNSSNTTHLVEIGQQELPTFFIRDSSCLDDLEQVIHFDLDKKEEISSSYPRAMLSDGPAIVGITAGASCPNSLIEETIFRVFAMRGIDSETALNSL